MEVRKKERNLVSIRNFTKFIIYHAMCGIFLILSCHAHADYSDSGNQATKIAPSPIRFYARNLSVGMFMNYWGVPNGLSAETGDVASNALVERLKHTGNVSMCDYVSWCCVEREEEVWDWSAYRKNEELLQKNGIGYNVFCWLHFPPKWYQESDKFVPYINLETGKSIPQLSLWSPDLPRVFERFYRQLAEEMSEEIDFLRVAMPSEYGEIGYCEGFTAWLCPQENAESGYWCGGEYAKKDFQKSMLSKYENIEELNHAWGTNYKKQSDIEMPMPKEIIPQFATSAAARQYWVDFIDWYQQAWVECLKTITSIIRRHFPDKELIASLGYGAEFPRLGNHQSRHIRAMSELGISCQSPGAIGVFPTRRVSSACRNYKVLYYTEPPGDVAPQQQLDRIFMDISNGVQTWFDYVPNVERAMELFSDYKKYMTGQPPRTTVAVWHPTLDHWLHPEQPWSESAYQLSESLRDAMDYEIVDDMMIRDGALGTLNIHQLILADADWLDAAIWKDVHQWVKSGGVLIVLQETSIRDIQGDDTLWKKQAPSKVPHVRDYVKSPEDIWIQGTVQMEKGCVLTLNTEGLSNKQLSEVLGDLCTKSGTIIGHPEWNSKLIDNVTDGILATRFDDKILYFNTTNKDEHLDLHFRDTDFSLEDPRPIKMYLGLDIPARTIVSVPLISTSLQKE